VRCRSCQSELIPGKRFCHVCGTRVASECPSCGAPISAAFQFCPDCGHSLAGVPAPTAAPTASPLAQPLDDPRLRHLPSALADKLRASSGAAGERKRATVLFCDLTGSTAIAERLDPEVYREILERYLALTFAEISRYEGLVNQLAGDGLMALFGAPIAHEDEPARAVLAALGIQTALAELSQSLELQTGFPLEARIGIHTGTVVAGTVGNDLKMDYTAIGDTTNLASRLQSLARPGTILISDATARLVEGRFRLSRLDPFLVKGKTEPIVAHEVLAVSEATTPMEIAAARGLTPLAGRRAELEQLEAGVRSIEHGLSQIVAVVGPAGSGKSRLLYEFRRRIEPLGTIVFEGRCSALNRNVPYGLWQTMLRAFTGLGPADSPEEINERVRLRTVETGYTMADEAPYLARFLGVSTPEIAAEPGEITAERTSKAYVHMLARASTVGRLVILIEDLQWIDEASLEGLKGGLRGLEVRGSMLVATHRPDYEHDWQADGAVTRLRLRPLGDEDGAAIVRAIAGGEIPRALEERILVRAEGNPFFLEEVTRSLLEGGAIARRDGRAVATQAIDQIVIPATVQELVAARIDRLRPGAKRVAQVAAVLGRQFDRDMLVHLLDGEVIDVHAELAELERAGVIHRKSGVSETEYRFGESFTQEVAYDGLLLRERRRLHDLVAERLLQSHDRRLGGEVAWIGRHLARGSDPQRGIRTLLEAGEQAEAIPSYGDAIRLYREAWELAETTLRETTAPSEDLRRSALRVAVRYSNASVLYGAAHASDEEQAAQRGIELARDLNDADSLARLHASRGFLVMNSGRERFTEGLALLREGYEIARGAGLEHATATLMRALAFAYLLDGRFEDANAQIEQTIAELERLGDDDRRSDTYIGARYFHYRVLYESDRMDEAESYGRRSWELAREAGNRTLESASAAGLATLFFARARYAQAIDWATRAAEQASQIDNVAAVRTALAVRCLSRVELGEPVCREGELDSMQRGLLKDGDLALNVDLIISALLAAGELERARRLAEASAERSGGRLREARNRLALGEVVAAGHDGDPCRSHHLFREALEMAGGLGARSVVGRAHLGLASVAAIRGRADAVREHAQVALQIFTEVGLEHFATQARRLIEAEGFPPVASAPAEPAA